MSLLIGSTILLGATAVLGQGNNAPTAITTTDTATSTTSIGGSQISSASSLKLAKRYTADTFLSEWDFFSDNDPTGGYVNYVSKSDAQSLSLISTQSDGSFIMRSDAETKSAGRGRNSIRISSQDKFADGVYILDLNHLPTGCGTWPAFWTTVRDGWPKGGEIDIIEGANTYPSLYSSSYNATSFAGFKTPTAGYPIENDVASLHIDSSCQLASNPYMTGTLGSTACSAYENGNSGCGAYLGGKSTFGTNSLGSGVNEPGGGWYAMWRDLKGSGGVYIYFWPRNASNVPDDVRYSNTSTTNVQNWGQPAANLTVPTCNKDFGNHVIVFNIAFCGDYAGATYTQSGCPQTCTSFTQNNPGAFGEAYWSINSLRVYTSSGKPASGSGLSKGAIAGIVVGVIVGLFIAALAFWRYRKRQASRRVAPYTSDDYEDSDELEPPRKTTATAWTGGIDDNSQTQTRRGSGLTTNDPAQSTSTTPRKASMVWTGFDDVPDRRGSSATNTSTPSLGYKSKSRKGSLLPEGEGETPGSSRRGSKAKGIDVNGVRIATKKPRTGRTVLRPGMTARNYLEGETPIGGAEIPVSEGFVMESRSRKASWAG